MVTGGTIGAFDLFHVGHLRFLEAARQHCDRLWVGVGSDAACLRSKARQPVIPETERLEILGGLRCVDTVRLFDVGLDNTEASALWIANWPVDVMFVGEEWRGGKRWNALNAALQARGIPVIWLPRTPGISSTQIRERLNRGHA